MNSKKPIIIIGARIDGQAGVVLDTIRLLKKYEVIGFLDNSPHMAGKKINGIPILGSSDSIGKIQFDTRNFHIGIGDNVARGKIYKKLIKNGYNVETIIHPSAILSSNASIGNGCYIGPLAIINNGTKVSDVVIINSGAIVEHDNSIGFSVHMAPGSKTAGRVVIEESAFVGIGATILPDITIGQNAMIGAGSTVVKNVGYKTTVIGYAAQEHHINIYKDSNPDV